MRLRREDITSDTLKLIVDTLLKLQQCDGVVDDDKLWDTEDRCFTIENDRTRSLQSPGLLHTSLGSAEAELRRVEAVKDALDLLGRSCECKLEALKKTMRPPLRHPGIQTLPDDVLSEIFRLVVDEYDHESVLPPEPTLSHVCTQFRVVAENTAPLWTRLSSRMTESCVKRYLTRSLGSALTVVISENGWSKGLKHFIQLVIPHASRWKNFKFEAKFDGNVQRCFPTELRNNLRNLQLPNLKAFILHVNDGCSEDDNVFDAFNFYTSWHMPNVHHIASSNVILASNPFSSDAIRTFHLTWSVGTCNVDDLIDLLVSLPSLTELRLDFTSNWCNDTLLQVRIESDENVLPNLTDLTIKANFIDAIPILMDNLRMPSLNKLCLILDVLSMHECLGDVPSQVRSSLKELEVSAPACSKEFLELQCVFHDFPALEKLTLDVPGLDTRDTFCERKVPPLRSFSLEMIAPQPPHRAFHPEDVVRTLKASGRWENFEFFEFKTDRLLTKQQAEILTEGKMKWSI